MSELHKALECLRPKDFAEVPTTDLQTFLPEIFAKAEFIANSVPPPSNGTPYESSSRTRIDANGAKCAADLAVSKVRRPPHKHNEALQKAWGKPLKLGAKDTASGISVYKMAGNDRHGAWFARTSVHEGMGFTKWKKAMMREFPSSLEVQGGPGEGNVRGIGGDQRLEDIQVDGIGKLEVYQLSAQFPGPTAPREFITLLLTSPNCLSDASKVNDITPRHYMVVSIPVTHPDAPERSGMVRGQYESVEMIREIPLARSMNASASTPDLLQHDQMKSRHRGHTISSPESRGPEAKGEKIDRQLGDEDPETNPVEWIMITRSDPGGGIPRFMVERGTPSSIVQDAVKFLDWASAKDDLVCREDDEQDIQETSQLRPELEPRLSIAESNGILAGVGTSITDRSSIRRTSYRTLDKQTDTNSLHRSDSQCSTASSSSLDSFASAEPYVTAPQGVLASDQSSSLLSGDSASVNTNTPNPHNSRELEKIEQKRQQLQQNIEQQRNKHDQDVQDTSAKSSKELEKAAERHNRDKKKQEEKFAKEVRKLEARRERETQKLLARQQKEADKSILHKTQRERDEYKQRAELAEQELGLLKKQIGELQKENTVLVAKIGKTEGGMEVLKRVKEEMEGKVGRTRAGSRSSTDSGKSVAKKHLHQREGSGLSNIESPGPGQ